MLNLITSKEWHDAQVKVYPSYKKVLDLAGQHAKVTRCEISNWKDYTEAIEKLAYLKERIDWDLPSNRHKRAMFDINQGCVGNVTFKRIMHHRNPERVKLLIHALMRDENDVPQPIRAERFQRLTVNVTA